MIAKITEEMLQIAQLREKGIAYKDIAIIMNKKVGTCRHLMYVYKYRVEYNKRRKGLS